MRPEHPHDPERHTLDLKSGPLRYTDEGDGPCVLALHGLPGSARDYRWLAPCLTGLRLVRLDLPGFGETPHATGPGLSMAERAALVSQVITALALERPILLGHSMGGGLAVATAATFPNQVAGLVLAASIGLRRHQALRRSRPDIVARLVDGPLTGLLLRPLVGPAFHAMGFPKSVPNHQLRLTLRLAAHVDFQEQRAYVGAVKQPTMIAHAEDDPLVEPAIFDEMSAALPAGPRLRFTDGGHNIQKTHATELGEAVVRFAQTLD